MQIDPVQTGQLSSVSGITPTSEASPPPTAFLGGTIDGIAGQLSMSTGSLKSALASGNSLTDIAQSKGVSRSTLVASIEQMVQRNRQASGQDPVDSQQLDRAVNRAVDRHRHHGHHRAVSANTTDQSTSTVSDPGPSGAGGSVFDQTA